MPPVDPVVVGVVRLAQRAVDEERVEGEHAREDEVIEHNTDQVEVFHLKKKV